MTKFCKHMSFKLTITIICTFCLLYQTYLIIKQYFEYNTVINIKFTPNVINSLPAITICFNRLYSFEKLVKRYPEYQEVYENYTVFANKFQFDYGNSENDTEIIVTGNKYDSQQYLDIIKNNDLDELTQMSSHQFSILDISENLTLPFNDLSLIYNSNDNNRSINIYSRDLIKIPGLPYYFDPLSDRYVIIVQSKRRQKEF